MQYVLFLYEDEAQFEALPEAEQMAAIQAHMAFSDALRAAGAYVTGMPLAPSATGRLLLPRGEIQDGPFADTKEQLGGLYVIHASSMEEAKAWAEKCPAHTSGGTIEIRAVPDYAD